MTISRKVILDRVRPYGALFCDVGEEEGGVHYMLSTQSARFQGSRVYSIPHVLGFAE
jgi:hypothetical protein